MTLPIPVERTWSVSDVATGAMFNANLRDGINYLLTVPVFYGSQTSTQSITTSTFTAVSFDTNIYDTYSGHSTTVNNSRYTAQVAGIYLCIGQVAFAGNATGVRIAQLYKNGSSTPGQQQMNNSGASNATVAVASALVQMAVGDFVQVFGFQASGGSLATVTNTSTLQVIWLHS